MLKEIESRRVNTDRRKAVWRSFAYSLIMNRRVGERRMVSRDKPVYVDVHGPMLFLSAMLLILFSVLDAHFTLQLIAYGSTELNPFLARMLEIDVTWFFFSKYFITAVCVLWLVAHKEFTFFGFKGWQLLLFSVFMYGVLISYQLLMIIQLP